MKFAALPFVAERIVSLAPVQPVQFPNGQPVRLNAADRVITLLGGAHVGIATADNDDDASWLRYQVGRAAYAAEVVQTQPTVIVRVLTFDSLERWPDVREIGVDDQTVAQARRHIRRRSADPVRDTVHWLAEQVNVNVPDAVLVVVAGGSAQPNPAAFRLIGESVAVDAHMHDGRLLVERIAPRPRDVRGRLLLTRGSARFVDATRLGAVTETERAELRRLARQDNAYLEVWNRYNKLERAAVEQQAQEVGWARYDERRRLASGAWEFDLIRSERSDTLLTTLTSGRLILEAGTRVPFDSSVAGEHSPSHDGTIAGEASATDRHTVILRPDKEQADKTPPRTGFLYGSFNADAVRLRRRDEAQQRAVAARTFPVHQLSRVLTGQTPLPAGRQSRLDPLSARARAALGASPTSAQTEAIDIALNTPDIALIQGPPGTGKTRVIAAIQARLTEVGKTQSADTRRTLLTSYQHDAVDNLALASADGRLPALKVSSRDELFGNTQITQWAGITAAMIADQQAKRGTTPIARAWRELLDRQAAYLMLPPDIGGTLDLLDWLAGQSALVGPAVVVDSEELRSRLRDQLGDRTSAATRAELIAVARSLRTSRVSHEDDGTILAARAFKHDDFRQLLDENQTKVLERAASTSTPDAALLDDVLALQLDVLDRLLAAQAREATVGSMPELEALLQRATTAAETTVAAKVPVPDRVVEEFRRALVERPEAVARSVSAHTQALAATCQQAVSHGMSEMQPGLLFESVIVDEAARANPLDLLIPMTLANRRIILVGDHRQLPQLLDQPLVDAVTTQDRDVATKEALERSMFEDLFRRLSDLEKADGIRRIVTLDQQFRTHPVLGDFVNAQFYEPHGEGFTNGRADADDFAHPLSAYNRKPAAWIDVPASHGGETGRSKTRQAEVKVIVEELRAALADAPGLTFGVIAFYRGQVQAIWEEMHRAGLAVREGSEYRLAPSMASLWSDSGLERVRIGTVDAFQGREFDVVYLSTTRSNRARHDGRRSYGFLSLPNRVCVAMSRQRRLLVVVGDAEMFVDEHARQSVPALSAFYDLTGGRHGYRRRA